MPPTRVRGRVLGFAFLLAVVTYLDRICISAAAPYIMDDLHLSVLQMSVVFSAFTLSYSLFEIPSGWLGDVKGPRRVLTRIVLWWSAFTMLTSAARGFQSLVAIRFLFGAGEAGAFPNVYVTAIIYACGALAWLAIDPLSPIVPLRENLAEGGRELRQHA
jgi:MFS family permease